MYRKFIPLSVILLHACVPPQLLPFYDHEKGWQEMNAAWVAQFDNDPCFATPSPGELPTLEAPEPTNRLWVEGNLDPSIPLVVSGEAGPSLQVQAVIIDERGQSHCVWVSFLHVDKNQWEWRIVDDSAVYAVSGTPPATRLVFDDQGLLVDNTPSTAAGYYDSGKFEMGWHTPCKSFNNVVSLGLKEQNPRGLTQKADQLPLVTAWVDEARTTVSTCSDIPMTETLSGELGIPIP